MKIKYKRVLLKLSGEGLMGDDSQPKKDFVFSRINFEDIEV